MLILFLVSTHVGLARSSFENTEAKANSAVALKEEISEVISNGFVTSLKDQYPIQLGAFRLKSNAEKLYNKIKTQPDIDAAIVFEDSLYKVRMNRIPGRNDSGDKKIPKLSNQAMKDYSDSIQNTDTIQIASVVTDTLQPAASLPDTTNIAKKATAAVQNFFFLKGNSPWLNKINYKGKSVAFINVLLFTIVLSIATMIILLIIILLNRNRMEKEEKLHQYLMEKYQSLIIDYLFGSTTPNDFRLIASDTYRRQVLIDQMIDVSINLKGDEGKKLINLYKHLNLDRDSISKAYDHRWHKKIKGFRELAFMNIKYANDVIYRALNSSNEILRMEAQIALVRLSDDHPFEFLSHITSPFSLWEQITLHELIIQHNIPLPSFQQWLSSPNVSVVMFALRMIREFKQKESEESVRLALLNPDPSIRKLAVQVAGDLDMRSTLETMKHMYKNQEYNICLEIIKSMGKMPEISMMGFLKLVLDKEDDVQLQIEAVKAIENNGEEGVKALVKIMKSEYKNYNIIVRHVLDRRIY
jgi:hypothetical protein